MRFIGRFLWLVITVVTVIISMAFAASNDSESHFIYGPSKPD